MSENSSAERQSAPTGAQEPEFKQRADRPLGDASCWLLFIGFLRRVGARWLSRQSPCRRLSRHRSGTCCNSPTQPESPAQTDAHIHARQESHLIGESPESGMTQSTKTGSGIAALDQLEGNELGNTEEPSSVARRQFWLIRQNDRSLPDSPRRCMRLLLSETGTDSLPLPYILDLP